MSQAKAEPIHRVTADKSAAAATTSRGDCAADDVVVADAEHLEPGTSSESMLITTDSLEEFSQQMATETTTTEGESTTTSKNGIEPHALGACESLHSCISDIQEKIEHATLTDDVVPSNNDDRPAATSSSTSNNANAAPTLEPIAAVVAVAGHDTNVNDDDLAAAATATARRTPEPEDYLHNADWLAQSDHVFVLSTSGKPIYTLHGNEDKLATIFGVMQALVSVVQSNNADTIQCIQAAGMQIVFLCKAPLILVAVSKSQLSVQQIQMELTDVYNQILSTLTLSSMQKILEERKNFDLRRLLAGSERLINNLVLHRTQRTGSGPRQKISNKPFIFLTNSVRILPLSSAIRDSITGAIQASCSKIKNLVFAVLLANGRLITLVRMKKYFLHPADLRLMFNLIECSESFKTAESWTPICLPKFDANGYLYAHVSYLADDCQACLLLLSVERDVFYTLSEAKRKITEKLRRTQCLKAIDDAVVRTINLRTIGIPEMRHFLYKSKSNAQLLCAEITAPYAQTAEQFARLERLYYAVHHRIHNAARPVKLIFEAAEREVMLGWVTSGYELYATFEPLVTKSTVITLVNRLLMWIKKEEDSLFILNAPTF